jgi:hypothetical protein
MNSSIPPAYKIQFLALLVSSLTWGLAILPVKIYRLIVYVFNTVRNGTRTEGATSNYQSISNEGASNIEEGSANEFPVNDILLDARGNQTELRLFTSFLLLSGAVNINYLLTVHNVVINTITLIIVIFQIFIVASYWANRHQFGTLFYNISNLLAFVLIVSAILGEVNIVN